MEDRAEDAVPISELLDERKHLLNIAYWMLGSGAAAESVVDETYRQWYRLADAERARIPSPRSWLAKVAGGICLARLAVPDPSATGDPAAGLADHSQLEDEISEVLLNALDSLSPVERAAFVLNGVFGMEPGTVADVTGQTEPEIAELTLRARESLRARRARPTSPAEYDAVARAVRRACATEDDALLSSLMAADVTAFFDGGGKVRAAIKPVHGRGEVARSLMRLLDRRSPATLLTRSVNGRPGLVVRYNRQVVAVISLDIADHRVVQVWVVLNPDKLRSWNQPSATHP
ncbi:sigma factor [Streptomyces sp. CB02400]|uniref:sigma factor n=1 Tax=Streptomyces sp. CB02400 TaxID=1703944 RepID=UPI00093D8832|nr:sigma factor [Streptomyces sp. CB02400]OKK05047.1 RNA polymerase subunit sigma [Streptomyces sp. CB02400]